MQLSCLYFLALFLHLIFYLFSLIVFTFFFRRCWLLQVAIVVITKLTLSCMILKIIQYLTARQLLIAMMDMSHQCNQAHHTQKEQALSARNAHLNHSLT